MTTAYVAVISGQSNADGAGMTVGGLSTSYQGHNLSSLADSVYTVKIWDDTVPGFINLSQSTSKTSSTRLGLGPQIPMAAWLLSLGLSASDTYIVKHAVDGTGLNHAALTFNWSADTYDSASSYSLLKTLLDKVCNAVQALYTAGYDDVKLLFWYDHQGEQDTRNSVHAYNYRVNKQNLLARRNERLSMATAGAPAWSGVLYPSIPRNSNATTYNNQLGVEVRRAIDYAAARYTAIHGAGKIGVIDTESLYNSTYIASDDVHWNSPGQEQCVSAFFAAYNTARGATTPENFAVAFSKTGGGVPYTLVQDTTFAAIPTITEVSAVPATIAPSVALTGTVSESNFDAGQSVANVAWYDDYGDVFSGSPTITGANFSAIPTTYHGHCIRSRYENALYYAAEKWWWTNVLAPMSAVTAPGTPKHWIRQGIGATVDATMAINIQPNYTGADSSIGWDSSGLPRRTHLGVAFQASDTLRALTSAGTDTGTTSQQNASLTDTGDWTRIFKGRIWHARQLSGQCLYGAYSATANAGMWIGMTNPGTGGSKTDMQFGAYRGSATIVGSSSGDIADQNTDVFVAVVRSGTTVTTYWGNGSTLSNNGGTTYTPTTNAYPDRLGVGAAAGFEGLGEHAIGYDIALTGAQLLDIYTQATATIVVTAKHLKNKMQMLGVGA